MAPFPDQVAAKAMNEFFTLEREVALAESNEEFVAALTSASCLEGCDAEERVDMLEAAVAEFDKCLKEGTWAMQALAGHPHGKAYVANVKADLAKSILTRDVATELKDLKTLIVDSLSMCFPFLIDCPCDAADAVIRGVNDIGSALKKVRAFDCHVHLLPNIEELQLGLVVTKVYESLRFALEPVCKITVTSGDLKAWIHAGPSVQKAVDVHVSLKSVPGMIQTTMEWKANIWMVKVLTGPTGGPQLDLPDWRPREWGQLGRLGWASHPPRLRWPRGSATSGRCWTRISPSLARSRS